MALYYISFFYSKHIIFSPQNCIRPFNEYMIFNSWRYYAVFNQTFLYLDIEDVLRLFFVYVLPVTNNIAINIVVAK